MKYIALDEAIDHTEKALAILKRIKENGGRKCIPEIAKEFGMSETQILARIQYIADIDEHNVKTIRVDVPDIAFSSEERLYAAVFGVSLPIKSDSVYWPYDIDPLSEIAEKNAMDAIRTLSEREQRCILYYFGFEEGADTLEKVGQIENISRERARQIVSKALRKLRHPTRKSILLRKDTDNLYEKYILAVSEREELLAKIASLQEKLMNQSNNSDGEKSEIGKKVVYVTDLLETGELSVRTFNVLIRNGITTLNQLSNLGELCVLKFRNLGKKSLSEIDFCMKKYGFDFAPDE